MDSTVENTPVQYIGFWARVAASFIDTILIMMVIVPVALLVVGREYFDPLREIDSTQVVLELIFPSIAVIVFWIYRSATPGKMVFHAVIVDATTLGKPSTGQLVGRYFAYFVSIIPFCLGLMWVGWDKRKQGWHDKLARTLVIREKPGGQND